MQVSSAFCGRSRSVASNHGVLKATLLPNSELWKPFQISRAHSGVCRRAQKFVSIIGALWATSKFCGRAPSFAGELAILLKILEFCEQHTLFLTCELRFSRTNLEFCKQIWNPAADLEVLQANSEFGKQILSFAGGLLISQPN